jgi:nucleoside-diphosphate-sugar epimerase
MRILVTGGTGFIGSHVVEALQAAGHEPIVLCRTPAAAAEAAWPGAWPITILGDVTDYQVVSEAVARSEGVVHLAGVLGTVESLSQPGRSVEVNVLGSLNVFDACRFYKKRCVYAGVGNGEDNNPYAISKHTAERFALMYNKEHRTRIAAVRVFNVYGERQKAEPIKKLIPTAIRAALAGEPIMVHGGGTQRNDFVYVRDVAANLVHALFHEGFDPLKTYELGSGVATSISEVVRLIVQLTKSESQVIVKPDRRPGENTALLVAKKEEWIDPAYRFTALADGLERTIAAAEQFVAA